ncbi:hypothetical protein GOODEAATRI_034617 [Goodea atripinnis]|uniref:Gnk2-homologous domain-containing protein n=1 Tax=Goodea atripinnis TaxID=208336 RepID=A0ABV0P1N9_9TELE
MNLTCITSEDPAALTVTKMYDENNDFGHFWDRNDPTIPLPPCSNGSDDSQCSVCLDQLVKVVCRNLTAGVKIFMEGPEGSINYNQTGENLSSLEGNICGSLGATNSEGPQSGP